MCPFLSCLGVQSTQIHGSRSLKVTVQFKSIRHFPRHHCGALRHLSHLSHARTGPCTGRYVWVPREPALPKPPRSSG